MSHFVETKAGINQTLPQLGWLVGGDIAVFLLFVIIGRSNHSLTVSDLGEILRTGGPFIVGWLAVAPWFGLFRTEIVRSWSKMLPRLLAAWLVIGGPLGLVLWALVRGRAIPGGIIPSFALVTLGVTTVFLIIWRVGYAWWLGRQAN